MPGAGGLTKTPFDFAVHNKQITNIKLLYHAMTLGNKGILYSTIFDRNLVKMLNLELNMKSYFNSSIPFVKISCDHFPAYDKDQREIMIPSSLIDLRHILLNYTKVVKPFLKPEGIKINIIAIIFFPITIAYLIIRPFCSKKITKHDVYEHEIDYYVVNLKYTLTEEKTLFMRTI